MTGAEIDLIRALEDVVSDCEQLIESLNAAAAAVEDADHSPAQAERLRAWAIVLAAPQTDANRVARSLQAKEEL